MFRWFCGKAVPEGKPVQVGKAGKKMAGICRKEKAHFAVRQPCSNLLHLQVILLLVVWPEKHQFLWASGREAYKKEVSACRRWRWILQQMNSAESIFMAEIQWLAEECSRQNPCMPWQIFRKPDKSTRTILCAEVLLIWLSMTIGYIWWTTYINLIAKSPAEYLYVSESYIALGFQSGAWRIFLNISKAKRLCLLEFRRWIQ